ncbi:MAG: VCBS repeat-containing protein [Runella slithyformis]|nr:MAG: VCBS repeat-containing protein [Runella slithyformis]TAF31604.1 MAG: VCBS repeat-containing protein [Cytophagales bacterium]
MLKIFFILLSVLSVFSCSNQETAEQYTPPKPSDKNGRELAQMYCGSCHQFPDPILLDKLTWEKSILPKMGWRLGINQDFMKIYSGVDTEEMKLLIGNNIYPANPQLAQEDWQKIVDYYIDNAPKKPIQQAVKQKVKIEMSDFVVKNIYGVADAPPTVTLVKFDTTNKEILVGWRGQKNFLRKYNLKLASTDSLPLNSPISDISIKKESVELLMMGLMDPSDKAKGELVKISSNKQQHVLLNQLKRPVQISYGHLNADTVEDVLICNFGNELGNLTWYEGGKLIPHVLKTAPGARIAYIKDLNGDKLNDIVVLAAQAREGIFVFYNRGNGDFDEKQVLEFPVVYGSSFIDLADFNKDGFVDILFTNGDNADLSMSLKAYHGIRIFMNDGKNNFKQSYFYPMFGASKALAVDFDLDGDLDIAAISFFTNPDQKPNEGFLLLKNNGKNQFNVSTFKQANQGKWMVMDVGDMDKDGDMDIILGSFLKEGVSYLASKEGKTLPSAIVLENKKIR